MTHPLTRSLARMVPLIRTLHDRQMALSRSVAELEQALAQEKAAAAQRLEETARALPPAIIEQTLSMVRAEYTVMPRYGFHQPIDYLETTIPPRLRPARGGAGGSAAPARAGRPLRLPRR